MNSERTDFPLRIVNPKYDSNLTNIVMELQYLRRIYLHGSTPPPIFFQLKNFFHLLESINSTRIEGNRKTIVDAVEARIEEQPEADVRMGRGVHAAQANGHERPYEGLQTCALSQAHGRRFDRVDRAFLQ